MVDKIWYNMEELIGGSEERGINRNILECKEELPEKEILDRAGINRNILECKERSCIRFTLLNDLVLIETYWNVKKRDETVTS